MRLPTCAACPADGSRPGTSTSDSARRGGGGLELGMGAAGDGMGWGKERIRLTSSAHAIPYGCTFVSMPWAWRAWYIWRPWVGGTRRSLAPANATIGPFIHNTALRIMAPQGIGWCGLATHQCGRASGSLRERCRAIWGTWRTAGRGPRAADTACTSPRPRHRPYDADVSQCPWKRPMGQHGGRNTPHTSPGCLRSLPPPPD
jgi:hypothetical protein